MGNRFNAEWHEYTVIHDVLSASSTTFLMFDNSCWWQLHPSPHVCISPLTVDLMAEALRTHRPRVVHLGTHGYPDGFALQWDDQKRLRLRLGARDILSWIRLDLRGVLVVSSACDTGTGPIGAAILGAGAVAYVAPQAPVRIDKLGGFMAELLSRCARALTDAATRGEEPLDVGVVRRCLDEALDTPSAGQLGGAAPAFREWYGSYRVFERESPMLTD